MSSLFPEVELWYIERLTWFQTNEEEPAPGTRARQAHMTQYS